MFNSKKKCSCGFERKYDNNADMYDIGKYNYCPLCSKPLEDFGYAPNF